MERNEETKERYKKQGKLHAVAKNCHVSIRKIDNHIKITVYLKNELPDYPEYLNQKEKEEKRKKESKRKAHNRAKNKIENIILKMKNPFFISILGNEFETIKSISKKKKWKCVIVEEEGKKSNHIHAIIDIYNEDWTRWEEIDNRQVNDVRRSWENYLKKEIEKLQGFSDIQRVMKKDASKIASYVLKEKKELKEEGRTKQRYYTSRKFDKSEQTIDYWTYFKNLDEALFRLSSYWVEVLISEFGGRYEINKRYPAENILIIEIHPEVEIKEK